MQTQKTSQSVNNAMTEGGRRENVISRKRGTENRAHIGYHLANEHEVNVENKAGITRGKSDVTH